MFMCFLFKTSPLAINEGPEVARYFTKLIAKVKMINTQSEHMWNVHTHSLTCLSSNENWELTQDKASVQVLLPLEVLWRWGHPPSAMKTYFV